MKSVRPTKEQYLKNVSDMQHSNLHSETFKKAYEVVNEYLSRNNRDIEYNFIKLFKKFDREIEKDSYSNGNFEKANKWYIAMRDFINELPDEVIDTNCVLRRMKVAIQESVISIKVVSEFISQVENYNGDCGCTFKLPLSKELENYNDDSRYTVELPLSKKLSSCFLDEVDLSESMVSPEGEEQYIKSVDSLPEEYMNYYRKYNILSRDGNLMIEKILHFQMEMILAVSLNGAMVEYPRLSKTLEGNKCILVDFLYLPQRKNNKKYELK